MRRLIVIMLVVAAAAACHAPTAPQTIESCFPIQRPDTLRHSVDSTSFRSSIVRCR